MSEIKEISLVLGTAGHIDHGKTTLVKAITGIDCDRLVEEKRRGITIELGFAPLSLDDGRVISLVDVPGHERFIRQMVAGASGIDAVLLVVAADEGVMPQTREHLSILQLLGVRRGIVVLTKSDKVEPDFLALAQEDVRELLEGTFLDDAPVIPVSASTGENIDALKDAIKKLVDETRPRPRKGALFLPIDRTFAVSGFGTVITGTAHRGTIHPNDEVDIFPSGKNGRIRSVQVHGRSVEEGWAGQRVAASIAGVSMDELSRGDVVCAGGIYRTTKIFNAALDVLPSCSGIKHWQRVHLLIGTSEVLARVSLLDRKSAEPGTSCAAQIFTEEPIVCTFDQKFILRFYSPLSTVAGGTVTFPYPKRERKKNFRRLIEFSQAKDAIERLKIILDEREIMSIADVETALQEKTLGEKILENFIVLKENEKIDDPKNFLISNLKFENLRDQTREILKKFHASRPTEKGMPVGDIFRELPFVKLGISGRLVRAIVALMALGGTISEQDGFIRLPDFSPEGDTGGERGAILDFCRAQGFQPPLIEEVQNELKMDAKGIKTVLEGLKNGGDISIVSGFVLSKETETKMLELMRGIGGEITLAKVRDATGSSRKYILPLLEHFDAKGITRRVGEIRIFR